MSLTLIAELSTNHGGDVSIAEDMIRSAADAGCSYVKTQSFRLENLNPHDPQRDWLMQSVLSQAQHERLLSLCETIGIRYLSTPFDAASLQMLRDLGLKTFKIASSESGNDWWQPRDDEYWYVSWPWGLQPPRWVWPNTRHLTAIPLYPTPLEAVGRAQLLDGYSCHAIGNAACYWAIANGAQVIEAHLALEGRGRRMPWDRLPSDFATLRRFAEDVATIRCGVSEQFRKRWSR